MTKNKVHFSRRPNTGSMTKLYGNRSRSLCGSDAGMRSKNVIPLSKEKRDVTCKHCKRMMKGY